ncbi:MAG: hypothetical protein EXX96DRAFT_617541 [Benjaminiella poitrasii]|nr:MAG: hypothetical protein EXX96DRAFT_617541 [Benjaminiella poitrasii]
MPNHSPHPNSLSPHSKQQPASAFQWPIPPPSPSHLKPINNTTSTNSFVSTSPNMNEITVREILDRYSSDSELLKYILTAKSEEDKKKAARDTLKAEEARIQIRQMDLDLAREQVKAAARHDRQPQQGPPPTLSIQQPLPPPPPPSIQQPPSQQPPTLPPPLPSSQPQPYGPYYGLAPVQQQLLARFHYSPQYGPQGQNGQHHYHSHHQPPPSPSVPYPHSAHPLCPPQHPNTTTSTTVNPPPSSSTSSSSSNSGNQNNSPAFAHEDNSHNKKRTRSSVSSIAGNNNNSNNNTNDEQQQQQDRLSHNKVMEALKAKIQRGNGGPPSPLSASPTTNRQPDKKRKSTTTTTTTVTRPSVVVAQQQSEQRSTISSNTSSPRTAKPVLPPIDTNLGRIDAHSNSTDHPLPSESNQSATSSSGGGGSKPLVTTTASPSDHVLLNTRRARSLSPSSSFTKKEISKS